MTIRVQVVRLATGEWTTSKVTKDPKFNGHEVFWVETNKSKIEPKQAIKIAQNKYTNALRTLNK